jgi:PAS domain S-box-containing protein
MSHPLLCWDIVMEAVSRRRKFLKDISTINKIKTRNNWMDPERSLENCLIWENKTIVITDATQNIVFASNNLKDMTGYEPEDVIGQRPAIFQGIDTCTQTVGKIKDAVERNEWFEVKLLNYRKDGGTYTCHIEGFPIFNQNGKLVNFLALEKEVA